MTVYPAGPGEDHRHTNTTMTYKMSLNLEIQVHPDYYTRACTWTIHWFIVVDMAPAGTLPAISDIFDNQFANAPQTWLVNRAQSRRFVIKHRWHNQLSTNGIDPTKVCTSGVTPANFYIPVNLFYDKLACKTEWKSVSTGLLADIKSGALYLIGAPRANVKFQVQGKFRMYFKSIGNQ